MYFFVLRIISTYIENAMGHYTPFAFCFQAHFKDLNRWTTVLSVACLSFLNSSFILVSYFFEELTSFSSSLEQISWQWILLVFFHLRIFLLYPHFRRIFSLNMEFWVNSSFLSVLKNVVLLFSSLCGFWWEILHHSNFVPL